MLEFYSKLVNDRHFAVTESEILAKKNVTAFVHSIGQHLYVELTTIITFVVVVVIVLKFPDNSHTVGKENQLEFQA